MGDYVIQSLAITGQFVPDQGVHEEFPTAAEAGRVARERHLKDGMVRRVVKLWGETVEMIGMNPKEDGENK